MFDALFAMTALPNFHPALVHFPIALSAVALLFEASRLKKNTGGMKFGDIAWGDFTTRRLETEDGRIQLAPTDFVEALPEALGSPLRASAEFPLILISGGRRSASRNTWTHNIPKLMAKLGGNWATLSRVESMRSGWA